MKIGRISTLHIILSIRTDYIEVIIEYSFVLIHISVNILLSLVRGLYLSLSEFF